MVSPKGRKLWIHRIQTKDLILFHLYSVEKVFLRKKKGVRISLIRLYIHIGIKMQDTFLHPKSTSQRYCPSWNRSSLVLDTWVKYFCQRTDSKFTKKSTQSWASLLRRGPGSFNTAEDKKTFPFVLRKICWKPNGQHGCEELLTAYAYVSKYCALAGWDLESWCCGPNICTILSSGVVVGLDFI